MTVTDYEVGDLIVDDSDGAVGTIIEILPRIKLAAQNRWVKGPFYKVHWFSGLLGDDGAPISTETRTGINLYRRLQ